MKQNPGKRVPARFSVWSVRLLSFGALLALWVYLVEVVELSPLLLPAPYEVALRFFELMSDGDLWMDIRVTLFEIVAAFVVALIGGLLVVLLFGRNRVINNVVETLLAWFYVTPTVVLFPLFIIWFGIGISSKIAYAALSGFIPIALNGLRGIQSVDQSFLRVGRAFGASWAQMEFSIRFQAARPVLASGIRVGAALCFINVLLAELLGSRMGVGYELARSSQTLDTETTYALIFVVLGMVGLVFGFIQRGEGFGSSV